VTFAKPERLGIASRKPGLSTTLWANRCPCIRLYWGPSSSYGWMAGVIRPLNHQEDLPAASEAHVHGRRLDLKRGMRVRASSGSRMRRRHIRLRRSRSRFEIRMP